jgi:Xaa-Pro aminopeptidase
MTPIEKLSKLRALMYQHTLDFYYVPSSDAHQNEYVPDCWQRRVWISGFTGSSGEVLIGTHHAYLWTDGRYVLQAQKELDLTLFQLMQQQQGIAAPIDQWLGSQRKPLRVGVDPAVITINQAKRMQAVLAEHGGELVAIANNWVDSIWRDRPGLSHKPLMIYPVEYSGQSTQEKLTLLREAMQQQGATAHVLNALDAIAWLYNIRGQDVAYNPVVISYAVVTLDQAFLCLELNKVSPADKAALAAQGVTLLDYEEFFNVVQQQKGLVWFDSGVAGWWMSTLLPANQQLHQSSPITLMKACKNPTEIKGSKIAHQRDGVAVVKFIHWLEMHWKQGVDEISVSEKLDGFRQQGKHYRGQSFATIAGFADHGAIIHYHATEKTNCTVDDSNLFLLDSGGQYLEGTTDITRVFHLGTPTAKQKRDYTLVLKGHLALRHMVFPEGVSGVHLDAFARQFLWQHGLDYSHGTGHGVGAYLCVHEGPQRISYGMIAAPLKPGMIVSNEPGLYLAGQYGIRVENLCLIEPAFSGEKGESGHGPFYTLSDLTLVPHNRKLMDTELLTAQEKRWINEYHQQVFAALKPDLSGEVLVWLKQATAPL